ncbi:hypothetical protein GCM10012289_45680 [Nonomuraea cavernae]|uniref:4Fe-4S ferredoxin-type domain-containing protein n=1 Tax=Nonomuraea cavernae TaxID=2045107 RepID=A0A917Z3B4_9ACTN|nr:hypothetical protein GCM10012289_45680 [Nonomuraea cavernae]
MSGVRDLLEEYHGLHVAPVQEGHERIAWATPTARCVRVRVREHTCSGCAPCYEFCVAGGLAFIRRSVKGVIHETVWTTTAEAERVWAAMLRGEAR